MSQDINVILRNTKITAWGHRVLTLLSAFVVTKLLIQELGLDGYGVFAIYTSIFTIIISFDFGISQSLSRFIARTNKDGVSKKERDSFYLAAGFFFFAVVAFQGLLLVLSGRVYLAFNPRVAIETDLLLYAGLLLNISFVFGVNRFIFAGFQLYGIHGLGKILVTLSYLAMIWIWYFTDNLDLTKALFIYGWSRAGSNILMFIVLLVVLKRRLGLRWTGHQYSLVVNQFSKLFHYSIYSSLFGLSTVLYSNLSVLIVGVFLSEKDVSVFRLILVIITTSTAPLTAIMPPLSTIVAQYKNTKLHENIYRAIMNLHVDIVLMSVAGLILYIFYGASFVELIVGEKGQLVVSKVYNYSLIVLIPTLLSMPFFMCRFMLVDTDQNKRYSLVTLWVTVIGMSVGVVGVMLAKSLLPMLISISGVLFFRSLSAYFMAKGREATVIPVSTVLGHIFVSAGVIFGCVYILDSILSIVYEKKIYIALIVSILLSFIYFTLRKRTKKMFFPDATIQ